MTSIVTTSDIKMGSKYMEKLSRNYQDFRKFGQDLSERQARSKVRLNVVFLPSIEPSHQFLSFEAQIKSSK
ncbi:MAG: hypothetical protein PHI06_10055 [Desulfobulbaceae bacterium]|nr:hypothetical protein [Desulfobulbaceae bacterium]